MVLLEAELGAGRHSSGRSAGLVRRAVEDPAIATLCREGAAAIAERGIGFERTGSVLIDPLGRIPDSVRSEIEHRETSPAALCARFPWLAGAALAGAFECPEDGVVDAGALIASLLDEIRAHGGEVHLRERAIAPVIRSDRVAGVRSERGELAASELVVATGAWGAVWGRLGGVPIALSPTRRSLVRTGHPAADGAPRARATPPWVWHLEEEWYFRADADGIAWSAGEELPDWAGEAEEDEAAPRRLRALVARRIPGAGPLEILWARAGHRSHLPDRRFLLGPDPRLPGWNWAVGLGGHGITCALAIAERVARALPPEEEPIDPRLALRAGALPEGPGAPIGLPAVGASA